VRRQATEARRSLAAARNGTLFYRHTGDGARQARRLPPANRPFGAVASATAPFVGPTTTLTGQEAVMKRATLLVALAVCVVGTGCGETEPPMAAALDEASLSPVFAAGGGRQILMLDACAPDTGFPSCTPANGRTGGISFEKFIEQLQSKQRVDAWRFAPDVIRVSRTTTFDVPNQGGVVHSFTEVAEFGGGFIPILNFLSGNPVPAPECVHPTIPGAPNPDVVLVPPGASDEVTIEPGAGKKYMCCIHPWMRATTM
jgi:hypothetical protein